MTSYDVTSTITVISRVRSMHRPRVHKSTPTDYRTAHRRVKRVRGKAIEQICVDCGLPALQWSYVGDSEFEQVGTTPVINLKTRKRYEVNVRWSPNVWDYVPRCRPCHRAHDKNARAERKELGA